MLDEQPAASIEVLLADRRRHARGGQPRARNTSHSAISKAAARPTSACGRRIRRPRRSPAAAGRHPGRQQQRISRSGRRASSPPRSSAAAASAAKSNIAAAKIARPSRPQAPLALAPTTPRPIATNATDETLRLRGKRADGTFEIVPNTRESKLAPYLDAWRRKVERLGTLNFPQIARRRRRQSDPGSLDPPRRQPRRGAHQALQRPQGDRPGGAVDPAAGLAFRSVPEGAEQAVRRAALRVRVAVPRQRLNRHRRAVVTSPSVTWLNR